MFLPVAGIQGFEMCCDNEFCNYSCFRMWEQLLKIPGNDHCCDCGAVNPRWASINLGITLCIGKHHNLCNYWWYIISSGHWQEQRETRINVIFTWMQDKIFSLNWHLDMWGCHKFSYKALNQNAPNYTMQNQTKACIAKSCEIRALLIYYAM